MGIVPRQFLRRLVNWFDAIVEHPDAPLDAPIPVPSTDLNEVEQRAAKGEKPLEYVPEPDDEKGYPVTSTLEF